jgi:hypothetical protein
MQNTKLKVFVNYDVLETNAYDFQKRLMNECKSDFFKRDADGKRKELDYLAFAIESSHLMDRILREQDDARKTT